MATPSLRRLLHGILGRRDELAPNKPKSRARLALLRLEDRDVPSSSNPLNGVSWTQLGPQPILNGEAPGRPTATGRFDSIAVDPTNANVLYAASAVGGIWRSTDGGNNWSPRTDQFSANVTSNSASFIRTVHRTPENTVYATSAVGANGFIYLSTDSATTFTRLGATTFTNRRVTKFVVVPGATQAQDLIYAAVTTNATTPAAAAMAPSGIYRSADGGTTWVNITAAGFPFTPDQLAFSDVDVDPTNKEVVYGTVRSGPNAGVYRITNGFTTNGTAVPILQTPNWALRLGGAANFSGFLPTNIQTEISPTLPSVIFAAVSSGGSFIALYRTSDTGINWTPLLSTSYVPNGTVPDFTLATQGSIAQGDTYLNLIVDPRSPLNPTQQTIYLAGYGDSDFTVIASRDSGTTWAHNPLDGNPGDPVTSYAVGKDGVGVYTGVRDIQLDSQGRLLAATEGGIFRMNDQFIPQPITNPPQSRPINWVSLNGTGTGALNSVQVAPFGQGLNPVSTDEAIIGAAPFHSAIKYTSNTKTGSWTTVDDQGLPFHELVPPVPLPDFSPTWGQGPVIYDFNQPNIVYRQSRGGMRRSDDNGNTWRPIGLPSPALGGGLAIDPSDGRLLFSGTDDVWVYQSTNDAFDNLTNILGVQFPAADFGGIITALGVSRQNKLIYVATTPGAYQWELANDPMTVPRTRMYVIDISGTFGGGDWVELKLPTGFAQTRITQILVDPNNQFRPYFTTNDGRVFQQTNLNPMLGDYEPAPPPMGSTPPPPNGFSAFTWRQLNPTGGVNVPPQVLVTNATGTNVIALDPNVATNPNDDILYLGTNNGVFAFATGQLALPVPTFVWTQVGGLELPNNPVRDLDINTTTGILSAGLNGRGVWQFQIRSLIRAQAFNDINGNGVFDAGETGLADFVVSLRDVTTNSVLATTVTDAQGFYEFRSVPAGVYTVQELVPTGWLVTTAAVPNITVGLRDVVLGTGTAAPGFQIVSQLNIGNFKRGSINGIKFNDGNQNGSLSSGEVGLLGFVIYIDTNGNSVRDWTDGNGNNVWDAGEGEQWTITNSTGNYTLGGIEPPVIGGAPNAGFLGFVNANNEPAFIVREVNQPGWTQTLPSAGANFQYVVPVTSGRDVLSRDFGNFRVGTITGVKFLDANSNGRFDPTETGLPGWTFFVDANFNGTFDSGELSTVTDSIGQFQFINLPAGTYRIREVQQAGWIQTTPNPADVVLNGTNSSTGLQFGNVLIANFRLNSQWTPIGPAPQLNGSGTGNPSVSGRVSDIATDPTNPNRYFITTASGGVWRTLDGGVTWQSLTTNLPGLTPFQSTGYMGAVAIAPSDPNRIYIATGESDTQTAGRGLMRSADGGTTWTLLQGPVFGGVGVFDGTTSTQIIVDRNNADLVFATINGGPATGVWRTTDGGTTWTNITAPSPVMANVSFYSDIQVDPTNPNVVYAAAGDAAGNPFNGIYRTSSALSATPAWSLMIGGSAFLPGTLPGNIKIAIAPSQPSTIYAAIAQKQDPGNANAAVYLGTFKSTDSGVNWTNLINAPDYMSDQGDYDLAIAVSPTNPNVVWAGGDGTGPNQNTQLIVTTNDGGLTWRDGIAGSGATLGPHTDIHAIAFDKSGRLLVGSDGGMFRLNNATLAAPNFTPPFGNVVPNWVSLNGAFGSLNHLNTIQFVGIATHPTDPNQVIGGSQDNGIGKYSGNLAWQTTDGGDAGEVVWDFDRPQNVYHIAPIASVGTNNYISKSTDGGLTWAPATNGIQGQSPQNTLFYPPIIMDPSNSQRLFTGTDKVWVTDDGGANWAQSTKYSPTIDVNVPDTPLSGMSPPIPIDAIAVGRTSFQFIFVSQGGSLLRIFLPLPFPNQPVTDDWQNVTPFEDTNGNNAPDPGELVAGKIVNIFVDPANLGVVYAIDGSSPGAHVWRSTNLGQAGSWRILDGAAASSDRLPDLTTYTVTLDTRAFTDTNDDILYIGNDNGVWALFNPNGNDLTWYRVGDVNLPIVPVKDLDLNTTTGILSAGTYGRGVWQTRIRGLIQGQAFQDTNGNGVFDSGEPAQSGITIRLLDGTPGGSFGSEIATTITDATGNYSFSSVRAGNYLVVQVPPAGFVQTTANPGVFTSFTEQSIAVPVVVGTPDPGVFVDPGLRFGNFRAGSISGVKFEDLDGDGVRDPGELGLAGFVIYSDANGNGSRDWTDNNGNLLWDAGEGEQWTTTDLNGNYTLTNLGPAVVLGVPTNPPYRIREIQQANFNQTSINPADITLQSGTNVTGIDFGNIRIAQISGLVFQDTDGDGTRDPGEVGVAGFTIQLIDVSTGNVIRTLVSDANGNYVFRSLQAGNYQVREVVPAGWIQTTPAAPNPTFFTVVLGGSDQLTGFEFGNFKRFTVSGIKFEDLNGDGTRQGGENGVSGFTFRLTNTTTGTILNAVSDAFGNYSFPNLGPGSYTLAEVQRTGWVQTTADPAGFQGLSGVDRTGQNFGNFRFVSATGIVFNDANGNGIQDGTEGGVPGFTIRLERNGTLVTTATTNASGAYSFGSIGPGNYVVRQNVRNGWTITAPTSGLFSFTATSSVNPTGLNFGNRNGEILAEGRDSGSTPLVSVRNLAGGSEKYNFLAYTSTFRGGVRVATGYMGSTTPLIVTAPGAGGGPHVRVWNSNTGEEVYGFFAYTAGFTGGVYVAVGDVNGDGFDDIVTAAGEGGGPHVRVWSGATRQELFGFFAYASTFTGGVRVAVGDVNGDGKDDIITSPGPGGGPHVKVFSGATGQEIRSLFAYDPSFTGGVYVAAGDVNGDGKADIITGAGPGGGPHVRVFNGNTLAELGGTYAYEASFRGGVRVAAADADFDGRADVIMSAGPGRQPNVSIYSLTNGVFTKKQDYNAFDPTFLGGVFVG
ncbi:MAG: FG-GAP-like repeat-containing protein [Gemmataceae bacterium]|nr:FG-GAP-like repeat-containing protein [Gemmataceae bacterium]